MNAAEAREELQVVERELAESRREGKRLIEWMKAGSTKTTREWDKRIKAAEQELERLRRERIELARRRGVALQVLAVAGKLPSSAKVE